MARGLSPSSRSSRTVRPASGGARPAALDEALPGSFRRRSEVPRPTGYVVFDCETTGTNPAADEVVAFALIELDADGHEQRRLSGLVRPTQPIPAAAAAVHGINDADVAAAPRFAEVAEELAARLGGHVFVAHNARFDLAFLQAEMTRAGHGYQPAAVACTMHGYRVIDPDAADHKLGTLCAARGIELTNAHDAAADAAGTAELLRHLLAADIAPESVELDEQAFMRRRAQGDTRPATEGQIRRVFGMARSAGLTVPGGYVDRARLAALVQETVGDRSVDTLTREQVQAVYDRLEALIAARG